jgi:hypothetical protein
MYQLEGWGKEPREQVDTYDCLDGGRSEKIVLTLVTIHTVIGDCCGCIGSDLVILRATSAEQGRCETASGLPCHKHHKHE